MISKYLLLTLLMIFTISCFSKRLKNNEFCWDFNDLKGWEYGHQDDNPEHQCEINNGVLKIFTRANSLDRKKIRTTEKIYSVGRYSWRTYIPQMGKGDQASIGCWIYCDDEHEIDFEIGYGNQEIRDTLKALENEMIVYMTTQAFPFLSVPGKITTGWHIFEIDLALINGKYQVTWIIDGEEKHQVLQMYGVEYLFYIFCSVENLKFMGDHSPRQDNYGLFDYVIYTPTEVERHDLKK